MSKPKLQCRAFMTADLAEESKDQNADFQGRWRLNAGSEMQVTVAGLNGDKPIRLVVDCESLTVKNNRVVALFDHSPYNPIGYWDEFTFGAQGVFANLYLVNPKDEKENAVFGDVIRIRALIRSKVPIQVSIGADAGENGTWEKVEGKITVNGVEYDGAGEIPLYVLRKGVVFESSIVTFGADAQTGRLAANKNQNPSNKEASMSDTLKALLSKYGEKHHGLIARCVAGGDDEATIHSKISASESSEKDEEIKALKAKCADLQAKLDDLQAKLDDYAQKGQEKQEKETAEKVAAKGKGSDKALSFTGTDENKGKGGDEKQPETLSQAMKIMAAADPTLKGFKLRVAARAKYPNVSEK